MSFLRLEALTVLDTYDIQDFKQLADFFQSDIKTLSEETNWKDWFLRQIIDESDSLYRFIKTKIDCTRKCPFCREPCQLSSGNHKKHYCGSLHRVDAVNGGTEYSSNQMHLSECTVSVRDRHLFTYKGQSYYYDEMQRAGLRFSAWTIQANDAQESKYWQWFTYTFQNKLIRHYGYLHNPRINAWRNITKQQVLQNLDQHYQLFLA